jgi:hypothetical protein
MVQQESSQTTHAHLTHTANQIAPTRKGFINDLAETSFKAVKEYDVKLTNKHVYKPTSFAKAGNAPNPQWFQAEIKEKDGMLSFQTWERLDQRKLTPTIRRQALRCHHLYDIKRDLSAKNRVVVSGSKQHPDTYTYTTSSVAGQMTLRLYLCLTAYRKWDMIQLDLTNAYLHAPIQDVVYIIIPPGFPREGEVVILKKAAYGTKQGARRFDDYNKKVLLHLGLTLCPNEPCLFRYLYQGSVCYLLQYVDDAFIAGEPTALQHLQQQTTKYFQCKFAKPKDFLGLDITHPTQGELTLSMTTFTNKMKDAFNFPDIYYGDVVTPGRTDKKINSTDEHEVNNQYRSQVGT